MYIFNYMFFRFGDPEQNLHLPVRTGKGDKPINVYNYVLDYPN